MAQARGSQSIIALYEEATYNTTPGTPSGQKLYVVSNSIQGTQNRIDSDTLSTSRERSEPALGNVNVSGPIEMELSAQSIGTLMKHAIGSNITGKSVSVQPTNVTGVEINYASTASASGNGTITFVFSGTTLSWSENGDTAGATQDISAGGTFTLLSAGGESINITVTAASIPASNKSDTNISVSATGYTHTLTLGDLPTGLIIEKDFGSNISGSGRFQYFNGCRISNASFSFPQEGYVTGSFGFTGAKETLAASSLDSSLDDNGHTSFSAFSATIQEGGSAIAVVTEASIEVDNDLDESSYVIGGNGERAELPEGFSTVSGSITALFDSTALLTKAINDTESSLKITLTRGTGDGSSGNELIEMLVQQLKYERASPAITGPTGVLITLPFKAYISGTTSALRVRIKNAVTSI